MLYICRSCTLDDYCRENMAMCMNGAGYSPKEKIEQTPSTPETPLDVQIGGSHYKNMPIQPIEFCQRNQLNFCESAVIKYVCRHRDKNGVEDIDKAIHILNVLKEIEYGGNHA